MKQITPTDIDILARTLYGEARGEDYDGKLYVAYVILNRYRTGYRGKLSVEAVCKDPWQFSCWNPQDPNRSKLLAVDLTDEHFRECFRAALEVVDGDNPFSETTRHYYARYIDTPSWAVGEEPVHRHGEHIFYADIA